MSPTAETRRRFLEASARAAVATWVGSALSGSRAHALPVSPKGPEKLLGTVPFVGEGNFPVDRTVGVGLGRRRGLDLSSLSPGALLTPREKFFVRTGCPDGLPPTTSWRVVVHGHVITPVEIPIGELREEAADAGVHLLECAGNSRAAHFGLMSVARWKGVKLAQVLERVRLQPRASRVLVSGFDEHSSLDPGSVPGASWIFGLEEIREAGAFLATEMNGAPLGLDHGYPLRLVVPGWYACAAIKWVNEIALVDDEAVATDHMREYAGRTHQDPAGPRDRQLMETGRRPEGPPLAKDFRPATIDPAAAPVRVERRSAADGTLSYRIVGVLWGGGPRGRLPLDALRIRLEPGPSEAPVEPIEGGGASPWTLWSYSFAPKVPGRYRIELRVEDASVRTRRLDVGFYAREIEITA